MAGDSPGEATLFFFPDARPKEIVAGQFFGAFFFIL
jgi:hypothetical protein